MTVGSLPAQPAARLVGLLGYPLGHSLSPALQQAAFDLRGLPIRYQLWEVQPHEVAGIIERLRAESRYLGVNITVPYKEVVLPLLDRLEPSAERIGAVNTVYKREGELVGANTDAPAFLQALRLEADFAPQGARALLLGAGGAARAVAFALLEAGVAKLRIANRTLARAEALAAALRAGTTAMVTVHPWEEADPEGCDLVINATSLGMRHSSTEGQSPLREGLLSSHLLAVDLVYNPSETAFLAAARRAGARTLGGLAMLVEQGALAFEIWTGLEAPREAMRTAAQRTLEAMEQGIAQPTSRP